MNERIVRVSLFTLFWVVFILLIFIVPAIADQQERELIRDCIKQDKHATIERGELKDCK